jgi:putative membrane protein
LNAKRDGGGKPRPPKGAVADWFLRFFKGAIIGIGFIIPGVSGGALAAVFGLYEKIISFIAHLSHEFWKNVLFFIPVGLGALAGIIGLSYPLSFGLDRLETPILWAFVGCILGTMPPLWKKAGLKGRRKSHLLIMAVSAVIGFVVFYAISAYSLDSLKPSVPVWLLGGAVVGLGIIVPGLSSAAVLIFMGLYRPLLEVFKVFDLRALIPLGLGVAACLLLFSKALNALFERAYTGLFHVILGVVIASMLMIVPFHAAYTVPLALACVGCFVVGAAVGYWMSALE